MIGLGLRLVVSGREALTRLVVLAVAVGLGVGLLLTAVAATNAVTTWNARHAWFWTGTAWVAPGPAAGVAPLWWHPGGDIFDGQTISRFDVAATAATSPVPPGIPRDPGPGQYYASPALAALLRAAPANQLAGRYPGHLAGVIGDAGLPSPDSLVLIVGRTPAQLAHTPDSVQVTSISTTELGWPAPRTEANPKGLTYAPADPGGGHNAIDLILSVVALAILAPVLIFIATATRLSAARREQRFAAMRLAGATRRQVSLLAATESTVAGILGVAAGFGIFFLLRIPVAGIPFIGQPFFPAELSLSLADILAVAIGVPVFAAAAARLALRRVHISPLGVARRATPKPPRAWRVVPLLAGLAELGFWTVHGHPASIPGQIQAFFSSFLLVIVGLFIAGPWLTMAAARAMARGSRQGPPSGSRHPYAGGRSPGWQGPAGPGPGRDGASFRDSAGAFAGCGLWPGHWLGQQQFADVAAEYRAHDVQLVELDRVRLAGPQARHLPRTDHHAAGGEQPLQFAGLPDAAVGGRQPQVPLHLASPFHRSAACCCPATQASSTCVPCTWTYLAVVPVQECPSSSWMANRVIPAW